MDDDAEIELRKICCTCLSINRKLVQLCKINDGVNILYFLLSYDPEAFRDGFLKDSASLYMCWECQRLIRRIISFRLQACLAQKYLSSRKGSLPRPLTRLSAHHKTTYDHTMISSSDHAGDNFIDCDNIDVKTEVDDLEDVPLSQLNGFGVLKKNIESSSDTEQFSDREETILINDNNSYQDGCNENSKQSLKRVYKKKKTRKKYLQNKQSDCEKKLKISEELKTARIRSVLTRAFCPLLEREGTKKTRTRLKDRSKSSSKTINTVSEEGSEYRKNAAILDQPTPTKFQCGECDKVFDNKSQRWKHVQICHREGHECGSCGKRFAFRNNLTRHQIVHSDAPLPRQECETCHKMIRTDLLKIHARIHMQRERFSCDVCDKTFVSRASYQHHLKYTMLHSNTDILKYKCGTCEKGYRSRGELRDHENYQHKGRSQHQCPICGKAVATRRCVTRHVRRAHGGAREGRPRVCQRCGRTCRDKKSLREHEFIHTGERPLSCEVCGGTFRQSASLYTHRKRVHKIHTPRKQVLLAETEQKKNIVEVKHV